MISFIILNYKSFKDTIDCINSIKSISTKKKYSIIVVDNASMTLEEKKEIKNYTSDVILLDKNVGFAKGNNEGASYAINKYHPDFLCVINSDTIIEQKNFIDTIYRLYDKYEFDVMGPKILPELSESCNPFKVYKTLEEINYQINYTQKLIKIYESKFLRTLLKMYLKIKEPFRKKVSNTNGTKEELNIALHGCALIFSKKYYEKFNPIFYPNTFLFHEEEFLYLKCQKNNLITLYSPELEIIHKEGQSVSLEFDNHKYKSLIFRNKERLKSLELLKKEFFEEEQ